MHRAFRLRPAALGLGLVLLLVSAGPRPLAAAEEAPSKTFAPKNFTLTLPSGEWQFLEVTPDEIGANYVARVARRIEGADASKYVEAVVYVAPTNGLTMAEFLGELNRAARGDFVTTDEASVKAAKLSGIDGKRITVRGKSSSGGTGVYLWHIVEKAGVFHGLFVKAYNGAEKDLAGEIDALRRGYRLIKGAGPEEPAGAQPADPPPAGSPPAGSPHGGSPHGGSPHGGSPHGQPGAAKPVDEKVRVVDPDPWPENGPKREGSTITFPTWNLKWTLPEGSPWQIVAVAEREPALEINENQMLLKMGAKLPGMKPEKPPEGEPEQPVVDPVCEVSLVVHAAGGGATPAQITRSDSLLKSLTENAFDKVDVSRRQTVDDAPVGNYRGAAMQLMGMKRDQIRFVRLYFVHLRGSHYQWEVLIDGDKYADDVFKGPLKALMEGVQFLETTEPVRGPWAIDGVPHNVVTRGKTGEAKDAAIFSGFQFKRPKGVYQLDVNPQGAVPGFQFAIEARSEDGKAYFYADVSQRSAKAMQQAEQSPETLVADRKSSWESAATDPVTAKGKQPHFNASFGGAKGVGYRFTGTFQDIPAVEKGYVVQSKGQIFWIREQFVGPDAEKTMAGVSKAFEKGIRFEK